MAATASAAAVRLTKDDWAQLCSITPPPWCGLFAAGAAYPIALGQPIARPCEGQGAIDPPAARLSYGSAAPESGAESGDECGAVRRRSRSGLRRRARRL